MRFIEFSAILWAFGVLAWALVGGLEYLVTPQAAGIVAAGLLALVHVALGAALTIGAGAILVSVVVVAAWKLSAHKAGPAKPGEIRPLCPPKAPHRVPPDGLRWPGN